MIIDTHCHYNLEPLSNDVSGHWKKAQENGIEKSIVVGTHTKSSQLALEIASKHSGMFASIGFHPGNYTEMIKDYLGGDKYSEDEIKKLTDDEFLAIKQLLETEIGNPKLVAIGEIGLDYYRLKNKGLKRDLVVEMQKKTFESQLKLSFENNLVAILHVRDQDNRLENENNAYFDTLEILKKVLGEVNTESMHSISPTPSPTTPKFILHCASGPMSYIKEAISLGAYVGVAGNITYDNAQNLRNIVKSVPPERLLLETDAPYLVPKSFQNQKKSSILSSLNNQVIEAQVCEPHMIKATAKYLKEKMDVDLDIILDNTNNLFFK